MVRYETSYFTCTYSTYKTASQAYFSKRNPLLENMLPNCKVMNISFSKKAETIKRNKRETKISKTLI